MYTFLSISIFLFSLSLFLFLSYLPPTHKHIMDRKEQDQERIEVKKEKNWVETEIKKTENETLRNKENGTTQDKWPGGVSGRLEAGGGAATRRKRRKRRRHNTGKVITGSVRMLRA